MICYYLSIIVTTCRHIVSNQLDLSLFFPLHKYRRSGTIQNVMSRRPALSNIAVGEFPASSYSKSITMHVFIITETFTLTLPALSIIGIGSINKIKYECCLNKWVVYWLIKSYFGKLHTFHNVECQGDWKLWNGKSMTYFNPHVSSVPTVTKKSHEIRTRPSLGIDLKVTKNSSSTHYNV